MSKYPDEINLIELAETQGSLTQLAVKLGVSRPTLTNYLLRRPQLDRAVRAVLISRAKNPVDLAGPPMVVREKAAKEHKALPNGSFPINTIRDLKNAISAYGRAKPEHRMAVRKLIIRRAKALGAENLIPDSWKSSGMNLANSSAYPDLERKPGKQNWVDKAGGLPSYIERIAKHLHYEKGMSISAAIATAVNTVKRWAAGGTVTEHGTTKTISAKTQAQAAAAVAQWEAKKASSHSHSNISDAQFAVELATLSGDELRTYLKTPPPSKKTPAKKGAPSGSGNNGKRLVRTDAGVKRYGKPIGSEIGRARNAEAAKAQQNTAAVDQYKKTVSAPDRDKQVSALTSKDLGDLSRVAFSFKSSDPNVVALRMSVVRELKKRNMDPKQFGYLGK